MINGSEAYRRLTRPKLAEVLQLVHLDVTFERASGCHLWPEGWDTPVLDLVGGYGTLLFGHNHPGLVNAAVDYLLAARPIHAQGSLKATTGDLAARLCGLASRLLPQTGGAQKSGDRYRILFANTGSEAVEAAIKHVMLERTGPIIALEGAFHGKTLGALQLTANPAYREGFDMGLTVLRVPPNDTMALRDFFDHHRPTALFLELIQGEGGVVPLSRDFVTLARELCTDAALVIDECQTGLGRTGTVFACEHFGLEPDLLILSKGLGGGIAKISALLVRTDRYRPDLGFIHTSTFADDDFSSAVALRVLDLLTPDALANCAETGRWLKAELASLWSDYPDVLCDVRGGGLMLGIEFVPPSRGFLLRLAGDDLGLLVAGYLYHQHRIRTAPTLSNPMTLRVQPSLVTPRAELERFVTALRDVCDKLRVADALGLTRYFLPGSTSTSEDVRKGWLTGCHDRPTHAPRVGWLFHMNEADDLLKLEPHFAALSSQERDEYLRHLERRVTPLVANSIDVTSTTGKVVRFNAILLPLAARRIRELLDAGDTVWLRGLVERGIDAAEGLGCDLVSLGQYTSIVMRNGLAVRRRGVGVTTGNAYAIVLALEAIQRAMPDLNNCRVAVVGASGNIGGTVSQLLSELCTDIILIGSDKPASISRMKSLGLRNGRISTTVDDCRLADVVVVAVSSPVPIVHAEHLAPGALVCDLSVPSGVDASDRTDVRIIRGGIARLPNNEDHEMVGFPLAPGLAFACMAEGMILALEGVFDHSFTGNLTADHVSRISQLATRHGFKLADYKTDVALEVMNEAA